MLEKTLLGKGRKSVQRNGMISVVTRERSGVSQLSVRFLSRLNGRGALLKGQSLIPLGQWYCQEVQDEELSPHHHPSP